MDFPVVLLDTNIVSYIMKDRPQKRLYDAYLENKRLVISFITVGELYYGAEKARWGRKSRESLDEVLRRFLVVPYDSEVAKHYASILANTERLGRPMSVSDAWIAACALRHSIPLVTHNPTHFSVVEGLDLVTG